MAKTRVRAYPSPGMVLLAFNWEPPKAQAKRFLGFAVRRSPGFWQPGLSDPNPSDWLLNRLTFQGVAQGGDIPTNAAPIQKFMWWDARFHLPQAQGMTFRYEVFPVIGTASSPKLVEADAAMIEVVLPRHQRGAIGAWFNRAVVSSQAFSRMVASLGIDEKNKTLSASDALALRAWLADGMERPIPEFLAASSRIDGAIYHLTDELWVIPAFMKRKKSKIEMVIDATTKKGGGASANKPARTKLAAHVTFHNRTKAAIMHDKILVASAGSSAQRVLNGSANFTTDGLTSQANVIHTWDSPTLAELYRERVALLKQDPTLGQLGKSNPGWSKPVMVDAARVRVFSPPEAKKSRESVDTIVHAIKAAKSSVLFCLFTPTDNDLRQACFNAAKAGKMMFGLVNRISFPKGQPDTPNAAQLAAIELYHRSQSGRDVIGAAHLGPGNVPAGFVGEMQVFPGAKRSNVPPVIIHHKFIVIDAETPHPTIYVGSANMSNNATHNNDENLLEITGEKDLAATYLAEFFRLYEHYRFRFFNATKSRRAGLPLVADGSWAKKYFRKNSAEFRARLKLA